MEKPFVRSAYNYDMNKASNDAGLKCADPTLTQQQYKDEADINTIIKRFNITGQLPTNIRMPTYQDFEGVFDYHSALNAVAQANEAFDRMPADVRSRFNNNPADFVDFCSNEENRQEAIKLGLVEAQVIDLITPPTPPPPAATAAPAAPGGPAH